MKTLFRNASIQTKLLFSHLILIAIPTIVIGIFISTNIYNLVVNDSIRQEQSLSQQTATTAASAIEQVLTVANAVKGSSYLGNPSNGIEDIKGFLGSVQSQVDGSLVTAIRIYGDGLPEGLYSTALDPKRIVRPLSDSDGSYWRGIFVGTSKYSIFCPTFYLKTEETKNAGDLAYIEKLFPGNTGSSNIYMAIYFSGDRIAQILKKAISINNSVYYIINEREAMVANSDVALAGTYRMDYKTVSEIASTSSGYTTRTVIGQQVYAAGYRLGTSDWYMVSILPAAPIIAKGTNILLVFVLLYVILLAIAFLVSTFLSRSITKRLASVSGQMKKVRQGPPVRMAEPTVHDEVGDLTDSYNYMTDQMNAMILAQEKSAEDLRISEIRALQAQINPHFLYNTMEMINWLSQTGKQAEVTQAIQALSKFYKLTLSKKGIYGTIESETEHVTLYVQLQNMRYDDRINFVVDIPEEMNPYEIPKLTFQPVVENAIMHGILEKESSEGTIVLTGWMEENDLIIQISDDGIGMKPEQLDGILSGNGGSSGSTNIGVFNTHRRIRTIYGDGYGLTYESEYGRGTDVEIRIPRRTSDQ